MSKLLSLCIPTYGVIEWVIPVIDSIYAQNVDEELYEVVVTDNGNNEEFEKIMNDYVIKHSNLIYKKTTAYSFLNEIESYRNATGEFIKFINHRTKLLPGSLEIFIQFVRENRKDKPFVYYTNGVLGFKEKIKELESFDLFVKNLSYWSSWSTGMAFWRSDFEMISNDTEFNELFPHTNILFSQRKKSKYILDDRVLLKEITLDATKKGKYDLFYAFAVEYPSIILDLLRKDDISIETFEFVKKKNLFFVSNLYLDYLIRKKPCSYDLNSYNQSIKVFYSHKIVKKQLLKIVLKKIFKLFK